MPVSQLMEAPPTSDGALCRGQRAAVADSGREALARLASVEGRSGVRWRNWARSQECRPERVFYPRTLEDLQAIVRAAAASGRRVSIAGRGHTMGPLSLTDEFVIDSVHLNRIGPVDVERRLVTVESGVSVAELDRVLRRHGLAMPTNVVLTSVRYGGIVATGCHGAGWDCQTISDLVDSMTIVTHTGEVVRFSEATHGPDVMNAVRCNLGTLGVIHDLTFRVEPDFHLVAVDEHLPLCMTDDDPGPDGHPGVQRDLVPGPGAQAPQRGARRGRLPALPAVHRECAVRDHVLRHCHRPRIPQRGQGLADRGGQG